MVNLKEKITKAKKIIRKAYKLYPREKTVVAWTGGKDSTVLLHLVKSTFHNKIPFPVMFNDSTMEFPQIYKFIDEITKKWQLDLVIVQHLKEDLEIFRKTKSLSKRKELARIMKVNVIHDFVKKNNVNAFISGIRWDEHESRSKEEYFSQRTSHMRVHPILHFTEKDIWEYIEAFDVPYVDLYKKGYRSLGEMPFTKKAIPGKGERSGRDFDKEKRMEKLRNMGYW